VRRLSALARYLKHNKTNGESQDVFFYHFNPKGRGLFVLFSHKRSSLFASLMIRIKRLEKDQENKTKDGGFDSWASHRRVRRYRDWRAAGWKAGIAIRLGRDCLGRAGLLLFIF